MIDLSKSPQQLHATMRYQLGTVVDNEDKDKCMRLRVRRELLDDIIPDDALPWIEMHQVGMHGQLALPAVGEVVQLVIDGEALRWCLLDFYEDSLFDYIGDDYLKSLVLAHRALSKHADSGELLLCWTKTNGLVIRLRKSFVQIEADGSVLLNNSKRAVHIKDDTISIGHVGKSAEPAVLGDQNAKTLDMLRQTIESLSNTLQTGITKLATTAAASPYTAALAPVCTALSAEIKTKMLEAIKQLEIQTPKTKSTVVSVD